MTVETLVDTGSRTEPLLTTFKYDTELQNFALKWATTNTIIWFVLFYAAKWYIPLPKDKIKKPFDAMIVRHRIVSAVHGAVALVLSGNYILNHLNLECGK